MFWISSEVETPDVNGMLHRIQECSVRGMRIHDVSQLRSVYVEKADEALSVLRHKYGIDNPNSPKQVTKFISENADSVICALCYDEKAEKWSSKADVVEPLANMGYLWADSLMQYRKNTKVIENIDSVRTACDANGLIHPIVSLQKTNRINYVSPALMNINKEILWKLIAPRKAGNKLWSIDIKNQEPWILINMLNIQSLKAVMDRAVAKKTSLYREIFVDIYGYECTSDREYSEMKRGWNMLTYGGSKIGLQKYCKNIDADKLYKYFNNIPEMKQYKDKTWKMSRYNQQTVETYFGNKVCADKLGFGLQRTLMDLPIQGTGADILALLIEHFYEMREQLDLEDELELYFSRHDEVIIEVDCKWAETVGDEQVESILREIFEHRIDDWEPFGIEIKKVA